MNDKTTVIAERTTIIGDLTAEEDLLIRGRLEGSLRTTKRLEIASEGVVIASVEAEDCVIAGVLQGDVTTRGAIHLAATARVIGDLHAARITIEAGAAYRGQIDMGATPTARATAPTAKLTKAGTPAPAPSDREAARPIRGALAVAATDKDTAKARTSVLTRPVGPARSEKAAVAPRVVTAPGTSRPVAPPPLPAITGGKRPLKRR